MGWTALGERDRSGHREVDTVDELKVYSSMALMEMERNGWM